MLNDQTFAKDEQQEKATLACWIAMCWNLHGDNTKADVEALVDKAFAYFDENMKRLYLPSTNLKYNLSYELNQYNQHHFYVNPNWIFDSEQKLFFEYGMFEMKAYALATFDWQGSLYNKFGQYIANSLKVVEPFSQKDVSKTYDIPFDLTGKVPQIYFDWNSVFEGVGSDELRDRLFIRSLFSHIWNLKNYQYKESIHKELIEFSNKMHSIRETKGSELGFVVDTSLIDEFKNPFLRVFAQYLKEETNFMDLSQADIEKMIRKPQEEIIGDVENFEEDFFKKLSEEGKKEAIKKANFFEKVAPLYQSGAYD